MKLFVGNSCTSPNRKGTGPQASPFLYVMFLATAQDERGLPPTLQL